MTIDRTYDPAALEARISDAWERAGAFRAGRPERVAAEPYTIVIPPPNVTGSLHMGHALNNTLQDILCRYWRMKGRDVLWQPGTDHAGIATQMVVERRLQETKRPGRRELGRDAFLDEVWSWKAQSGGRIIEQLKRLGCSCDWSRERFTMGNREDGETGQMQRAVLAFFVRLYREGLIYRDKRLVNWDPKFQTAISDLEVEQVEIKGSFSWKRDAQGDGEPMPLDTAALFKLLDRQPGGHLYHIDYPLVDDAGAPTDAVITVATTRPETMLGDTAVAVHPEDERYRHLHGRHVLLPLVDRLIPIVADTYSDPEKGTGAVKITPAHDVNDFEVARRHNLPMINIFNDEAALLDSLPEGLAGLDRFAARKQVILRLAAQNRLRRIEPTVQQVPHGDRSGVPIEPRLTDQWYVDVQPLAARAMAAVRDGATRILPENRERDFFRWMEGIQPWCISRQLWWGHRIPAWYGPEGAIIVAHSEAEAMAEATRHWGEGVRLERDGDVLDTWFSSALWPFSTLGWPDDNPMLARHYPGDALVTGADILFFWVARMMMAGLFTQGRVPFRDVYLHGLVRDDRGRKMSKTLGNVLDPLDVIDQYGADALRFTIASMAAQNRDPKIGPRTSEAYRNFCTKLWNAARFAEMNGCRRVEGFDPMTAAASLNRWIVGEAARAVAAVARGIESYQFADAALAAYRFVWNSYCDWYLELAKPILQGEADAALAAETRATAAAVLETILAMLHPFMPFVTEELWARTGAAGQARDGLLALAPWPTPAGLDERHREAEAEIGFVVDLVSAIRSVRAEMNVPPAAAAELVVLDPPPDRAALIRRHHETLKRLARLDAIRVDDKAPPQSSRVMARGVVAALPLAGLIDLDAERQRLEREAAKQRSEIAAVDRKLDNPDFVARAPEEVIEENRERRAAAIARLRQIEEALASLR